MFTERDLELLTRPLFAMITAIPDAGGIPAPRPVWFEVAGDDVQIFSLTSSPRVRRLEADPRASIVVSAPMGEPEHCVAVEGSVAVTPDGALELADRLSARYREPDKLDDWSGMDLVRIVLTPTKVRRFTA
ncbi:pyridoxamine 5'-phosphate oxidase family protein [Glaciihabitans arcticus]|uniref:Pyridoxamine 5'-phosphate oxidase family protein n=1 Tax=Glaciihabitans arcticus TaxID=2668039 RepID=A0A4Q9GMH9_9MICO|nr:pyridoxamine 5'-phosphate oxidase family protein [Glaciihabitans arcticus]TBN55563.1 pyridoxamine 5'-phosphate oxidase family protein [Glaciihabitans arcticus]